MLRTTLLLCVLLASCHSTEERLSFAKNNASLKLLPGYVQRSTQTPDSVKVASTEGTLVEIELSYKNMRPEAAISRKITANFINGFAGTFGAKRFKMRGPSIEALVQQPTPVGTGESSSYSAFGAVAFPEAIVTFRVNATGPNAMSRIVEFNEKSLPNLLEGLRASGA